jgi:predicted metal-dependent hydrolase
METHEQSDKFQHGIGLFNNRRFFDAHETWEEIWLQSAEPDKGFLQGIIQISAAFHHYLRGNSVGSCSLLNAGLRRLAKCPADFRGMALDSLRQSAREWADLLAEGIDPGPGQLPQIDRAGQ